MRILTKTVATTGSAGSASGSVDFNLLAPTRLLGVEVDYDASLPATTDLTVTAEGRPVLTLANSVTDRMVYPTASMQDANGVDVATYTPPLVRGRVTVALAQTNALDPAATLRLWVE